MRSFKYKGKIKIIKMRLCIRGITIPSYILPTLIQKDGTAICENRCRVTMVSSIWRKPKLEFLMKP